MAHASNENAVYPTFVWDTFPKAGASQLHPHMHVFLSPNYYQGQVEWWRQAVEDYFDPTFYW